MAKIWPVYEGNRPTDGGPWAEIKLADAIALFDLREDDFVTDFETTPRFGPVDRDLTFAGFKHVVVEVDRTEARQKKWKPGFYRSRIRPKEAFRRLKEVFGQLIREALVAELGENNVVRVDWSPTIDSLGENALKITAVITPGALRRIKQGATLDALVRLRDRLSEMGEERIPIVHYATEAELAQDAGP